MSGDDDRPGVAPIWGIVFALMFAMLVLVIVASLWLAASMIDWDAVLRFIAPTAFETRPIEDILEGGRR
ncbi:hypothetical protein JWJ88_14685 [Paracoccus methylovorus]|uniref:Phosphate ABC transporter permease subunit PstC n=1 Tax=Paracoccus methylovorus TaxID=2812658 RepID=A0ABX7JNL5_9RHOB|nr:hypothetical protein [Paracoccus methylovorus]QRZ15576.1 hypothetical protein JWJ88_14685 [Paracoccus methylovorus]